MFRQLDFQDRVITSLNEWLDLLIEKKAMADRAANLVSEYPDVEITIPDFTAQAWQELKDNDRLPPSRNNIPFSQRKDGCNRPVPNAVLKVPTGGGKTWLAISTVSRIMGRYLNRNNGFVLWIVPNEAIYNQTLKNLKNRQHPYRQALDSTAAGCVKVMEKNDRLDARDIEKNLCVMLLMLQSANRTTKESLKLFQDRGDVHGFFPPEGDQQAHKLILEETPNLDKYSGFFPMVKDSLGNALRIVRPVVILDEGHRATSDLAFETLYGFNPCFVIELTATPKDIQPRGGKNPREGKYANVLVEVTGRELDREAMIKMPLNLDSQQGTDWKTTLNSAMDRLNLLAKFAQQYHADTGNYIRPIMLVQAERTGTDQHDGNHIHSEDVKEWLLTSGLDDVEIAIKTASTNDLNQPENQDLLATTNRIRVIITKKALQEGWDCPFAYVLCSLATSTNPSAMTQLVGRILRQPHATRTGIAELDECYVITHHANTGKVVKDIKKGLEQDGLGDLTLHISQDNVSTGNGISRKINRRPGLENVAIYLPKVITVDGQEIRELDYDTDVLAEIDWRGHDPMDVAERIPMNFQAAERQLQRIRLVDDGDERFVGETVGESSETTIFDPVYAVRLISDIIPNPFVGNELVCRLLGQLQARGFNDTKIGRFSGLIIEELRKGLNVERSSKAEIIFREKVSSGRIQFRLRLDGNNWSMPDTIETNVPVNSRQVVGSTGVQLSKSLFSPVYEDEMNSEEREVAVYLDEEKTLAWWHRNVARSQYSLQGWKRDKIYPDFIFAVNQDGLANRITVLETKGNHLDNPDTDYKRKVMKLLSDNFSLDECTPAGELELVWQNGITVQCDLVLMGEWPTKLPRLLNTNHKTF
ncbi:MAG: type III restriction endonuclease subunit R [Rhodobacteraceae bacterium]|nr:type III restriction endonuclease subunit R [Paracoccaceae bacterium]